MRFEGKTSAVTRGMSGIGRATADRLRAKGASVIVIDIADDADITLDISDLEAVGPAISAIGPVEVLVNCAGWDRAQPFTDTTREFWAKVVAVNLLGPIAITHAALQQMPDGGSIVNVASDAGRVGSSGEVVNSAAKGGIIAFSKALAARLPVGA